MQIINIYEAKSKLSKLVDKALKGEEIIIAKSGNPLVRLDPLPGAKPRRLLGQGKSYILSIAKDFDEPLEDFKDYMP